MSSEVRSWASSEGTRLSMLGNRRRDTGPELAVRKLLHAGGLRYRVDVAPTTNRRRRADIVFTRQRVAVFIDGCFWHGCPEHRSIPKANAEYWGRSCAGTSSETLTRTKSSDPSAGRCSASGSTRTLPSWPPASSRSSVPEELLRTDHRRVPALIGRDRARHSSRTKRSRVHPPTTAPCSHTAPASCRRRAGRSS